MKQIELTIDGKIVFYRSEAKTVYFETRYGVTMVNKIPEDWGLTRIFKFMESLVKADDVLI